MAALDQRAYDPAFTDLQNAAKLGNVTQAEKLISQGCDLDAVITTDPLIGCTALHLAVQFRQIEMIKILVTRGADYTLENANNATPLQEAFESSYYEAVEVILTAYYTACSRINEKIKLALNLKQFPVDNSMIVRESFLENLMPLHFAVKFQLVDIIPILLDKENEIDTGARDSRGMTALHYAVQHSQTGLLKGDHIYQRLTKNPENTDYPLRVSTAYTSDTTFPPNVLKIVNLLLRSGCDVNARDDSGRTPIFYLFNRFCYEKDRATNSRYIFEIHSSIVRWEIIVSLMSHNSHLSIRDLEGSTILHMIAKTSWLFQNNADDIVLKFLKTGDVNALDGEGYTALHYACGNGCLYLVRLLLASGADANLTRSRDMQRPIHAALLHLKNQPRQQTYYWHSIRPIGGVELLELLLMRGALVDATMTDGTTAILLATSGNFDKKMLILHYLVECDCEINCADGEGNTPLHNVYRTSATNNSAIEMCFRVKLIDDFVRHGADVNALNHQGHAAFSSGFDPVKSKMANVVYSCLKRLTILGAPLCPANQKLYLQLQSSCNAALNPRARWYVDEGQCRNELDSMRVVSLDDDTALYDILLKDSKDLVQYLDKITSILADPNFELDYPNYGYLVKNKLRASNKRRRLVESASEVLVRILQLNLPDVFQRILEYLSLGDLLHLVEAGMRS